MDHGDRPFAALQLIPGLDLAEEDVGHLTLGELEVLAAGIVVGRGDGAAHHRDLQGTALGGDAFGEFTLGGAQLFIGGAEINAAGVELAHTGAGTHRLVVDLPLGFPGKFHRPALIGGSGKAGPGAVDRIALGDHRNRKPSRDSTGSGENQGLLSEGHQKCHSGASYE